MPITQSEKSKLFDEKVYDVLKSAGSAGIRVCDVCAELDAKAGNVTPAINRLVRKNRVIGIRRGVYKAF